jgi:hypothetical protein
LDFHTQGKYQDAIKAYSDAIRKAPKAPEAYNWRGMAYDDLGDLDKALQDLTEAIKLNGNYADAYNNRGEVYRKKKMYREAMADYSQAVKLDPNFSEAYYNQGLVFREQNNARAAEAAFRQYLRLKPDASDKQEVEDIIKTMKAGGPPAAATKVGAAPAGAPTQPPGAPTQPTAAPATKAPAQPGTKPGQAPQVAKTAPPAGKPGVAPPAKKGAAPTPPPDDMTALMGVLMSGGDLDKVTGVLLKVLDAILIFLVIGVVVYWIITSLPYMLIAGKTGTGSGWMAFLPVMDEYLKAKIAGKGMLMFILLALGDPVVLLVVCAVLGLLLGMVMPALIFIVPIVYILMYLASTVAWVPVCMGIAQARGKASFWGLLICVPFIVVCILNVALSFVMPELAKEPIVGLGLLAIGVLPYIGVPYYLALSK